MLGVVRLTSTASSSLMPTMAGQWDGCRATRVGCRCHPGHRQRRCDLDAAERGHEPLSGVAFPNAMHGWAVGQNGTILATSTGGN